MKVGDLIKPIKNDMSVIIRMDMQFKDNLFFDNYGIIIDRLETTTWKLWFIVTFPSGIYAARHDAIEIVYESG